MKLSIISFFVLSLFLISSCQKGEVKVWTDKDKEVKEIEFCEWDISKVADSDVWEEYIVEELVTDDACGCIVEGVVKYVKIDNDFAHVVYYGKGECDGWAYLVTYYDLEGKKVKKCKFEMECEGEE